jgi:hypothetical protein
MSRSSTAEWRIVQAVSIVTMLPLHLDYLGAVNVFLNEFVDGFDVEDADFIQSF